MGSLHIQNQTYSYKDETISRVDNLDFWKPLMNEVLPLCTDVEVHCWVEDKEAIQMIKSFAHTIRTEHSMVILTMPLNHRLKELLLNYAINDRDSIYWYSLFFSRNGSNILSVEHNGAQLHFFQITREEGIHIQSFFPNETIGHYIE